MAFVFDTNVLISAVLLENSVPYRAFERAEEHDGFLTTVPLLAELDAVLRRTKFDRYVPYSARQLVFRRFA